MIRYAFIHKLILNIYREMDYIKFPLRLDQILKTMPNCRYMSYSKFATVAKCSLLDVILMCDSQSGCTHYDVANDRYLILVNEVGQNSGRRLWTSFHELGHIFCNHHIMSSNNKLAENNLDQSQYEKEADYFAANILAPLPLFEPLGITDADDIQYVFGLSAEASTYRWNDYQKWKYRNYWDNDLVREFKRKGVH